jgi:NAD(P)-dependent dehydrogenase (short-subunit alcohol dehydrogenase family)
MNKLGGKIALVTGGSQGLGQAVTQALLAEGVHVAVCDVKEPVSETLVNAVTRGEADFISLDVSKAEAVFEAVHKVFEIHKALDIVINNAGTDVTKPVDELSVEEWDRVLNVNLRGPFVVTKAALEFMYRQKTGHIVNITSTAAKRAWPNAAAYHASKWGLLGLNHALFTEARQHGVKVSAVVSGGMRTPFILERFPETDIHVLQPPENVAQTILFLLKQPPETIIPEVMVLPLQETSWP